MKTMKQNSGTPSISSKSSNNSNNIVVNDVSNFEYLILLIHFSPNQIFQSLVYQLNFDEPNTEKEIEINTSLGNVIDLSNILEFEKVAANSAIEDIMKNVIHKIEAHVTLAINQVEANLTEIFKKSLARLESKIESLAVLKVVYLLY